MQSKKLEYGDLPHSHQECYSQDAINSSMKKYYRLKALQMIDEVDGPIVGFSLWPPELWRDSLAHNLGGEGRLRVELRLKWSDESDLEASSWRPISSIL